MSNSSNGDLLRLEADIIPREIKNLTMKLCVLGGRYISTAY